MTETVKRWDRFSPGLVNLSVEKFDLSGKFVKWTRSLESHLAGYTNSVLHHHLH